VHSSADNIFYIGVDPHYLHGSSRLDLLPCRAAPSCRVNSSLANFHIAMIAGCAWDPCPDWRAMLFHRKAPPPSAKFLVYASSHCTAERERVFSAFYQMAEAHGMPRPEAVGGCRGGLPAGNVTGQSFGMNLMHTNAQLFRSYKFVLCMENSDVPFYVTEKILNAFASGAVPVYWGGHGTIDMLFDPRSFVYVDPAFPQGAFERLRIMSSNYSAYRAMADAPVFKTGAIEKYLSLYAGYPLGGTGAYGARIRYAVNQWLATGRSAYRRCADTRPHF